MRHDLPNKRNVYHSENHTGGLPRDSPHTDEKGDDGTDTDHYMAPDAEASSDVNPRSKFDLRHNPKPNCNDDYRY